MNILAEEQKLLFEPNLTEEEYQSREQHFLQIYYHYRQKNEASVLGKMTLKSRKRLHKLILLIYTIKNHLSGFSFELIGDKRTPTDRPIIYAITHVGKFDIEIVSEAIKDHYYLLSGDYEHLQGTIDASFLSVNGVIYFNERDKKDRTAVSDKMIKHLQRGGNLMYFPEGTWNMSPNLPVLPCFWGIIGVAQKGNAIIIPVAAEQYDKHFKINIGSPIDALHYGISKEEKAKAISDLRDTLSTLKWEIWETEPLTKREIISGNEWEQYCTERFMEWPYFNLEYINRLVFHPKEVIPATEIFEHLDHLKPCLENAFLFNKRLLPKGPC